MLQRHPAVFIGVVPRHYILLTWKKLCVDVRMAGLRGSVRSRASLLRLMPTGG